MEQFLEPGSEVFIAHSGEEVAEILDRLDRRTARRIGRVARNRVLSEHTYTLRARQVEKIFNRTN